MILLALKVVAIIVCIAAAFAVAYAFHVSEVEPERWSGQ